jgi:RHS repeat-associated protein
MMGTGEVYTAFGERVSTTAVDEGNRYGYAGAWGYQAHEEFPFLHVGARYYDPATGRFLQRDPIGIEGGLNVYAYVDAIPASRIDPDGMTTLDVKVIYESKPRPPVAKRLLKGSVKYLKWGKNFGNLASAGGIVCLVAQHIIAPAIDAHTDYRERKSDKELGAPFDPKDPWGWTEKTPGAGSWRHKRKGS